MRSTTLAHFAYSAGTLCVALSLFMLVQRYNPSRLSFASYIPTTNTTHSQKSQPSRLVIPSVGIDTPIEQSEYTSEWDISTSTIHHLSSSPVPTEAGNSIMYGHNWPMLLGPLVDVKPGSQIQVHSTDGSVAVYEVVATAIVDPDATEVLRQTEDARLTVYTCTGFLDSKRFVVSAVLRT